MSERLINDTVLQNFSHYLRMEEKSEATQEKYLRDTRSFMAFTHNNPVTKTTVITWKKNLREQGYAVRSVNSMLAAVNCLFDYLGWQDCKVKNLRLQKQTYCAEEKELTKTEYLRLLDASKKNDQLNLILQTICATGIRVSELQHFTVESVKIGEIAVNCKNKTRTILIPAKLRKRLLSYVKQKEITTGVIFQNQKGKPLDRSSIWRQMKRLCSIAGVKETKVFPHNLRKLFARTFYGIEKDIAKLADILGHSSINTTRIYIMSTGTEHRRKLERLGLLV